MKPGKSIHIGKNIERIRMLRGMQQDELGSLLGVTQGAISKMEHSERISNEKLEKVACALKVTAQTIVEFNEQKTILNLGGTTNVQSSRSGVDIASIEQIVALYERLLESEKSKNALLQTIIERR